MATLATPVGQNRHRRRFQSALLFSSVILCVGLTAFSEAAAAAAATSSKQLGHNNRRPSSPFIPPSRNRNSRQSNSSNNKGRADENNQQPDMIAGDEIMQGSSSDINPIYLKELPAKPGELFKNRREPSNNNRGQLKSDLKFVPISSSYDAPLVPVDTRLSSNLKRKSGLKTEYYPPAVRVMPRVSHMEAECSDDVMKLRVKFNATFGGLIYSAGYAYDNDCIYINGTGEDEYEFYIQLNRCGTLGGSDHNKKRNAPGYKNRDPTKNYMWNTVTIQYNPLIEEEWDEHFKVTCEYGYDFWKTVTFPFLDVEPKVRRARGED